MTEGVVKNLNGNSGCRIYLYSKDKTSFVRKVSKNISYNARLRAQFEKQVQFNNPKIKTPKVFEAGFSEGLFYIDMEYTSGLPLNDFVVNDSPVFCQKIISTLLKDRQTCKFPHNELKLKNKIETISSSLKNDNKLLFECKKKLIQLYTIDWPDLELSFCHGDLTFENIIIKNDEIYLIDFLDSFIDNYLIDASKLVMDLIIGWSWRHSDKVPYVKNSIILSNIYKMFSDQEVDIINKFVFLHLLRIHPYCECEKAKMKIELGLEHSIKNFNFS